MTRAGGLVAVCNWGRPADSEMSAIMGSLGDLYPPGPPGPARLPVGEPGVLGDLCRAAGLEPERSADVDVPLEAPDRDALEGVVLAAGAVQPAIEHAGAPVVRFVLGELGLDREEVERADVRGELGQRVAAGEGEVRAGLVLALLHGGPVGDVLAQPLLTSALQVEGGGEAPPARGEGAVARLDLVAVDLHLEVCEAIPRAHRPTVPDRPSSTSSMVLASGSVRDAAPSAGKAMCRPRVSGRPAISENVPVVVPR